MHAHSCCIEKCVGNCRGASSQRFFAGSARWLVLLHHRNCRHLRRLAKTQHHHVPRFAITGRGNTVADLRQIMNAADTRPRGEGTRGPLALLATDPGLYGRMCTYAMLRESTLTIEVFRDLGEAEQWLTARVQG